MNASDLIKKRIAELKAAKEATQPGVTNDPVRDERKELPLDGSTSSESTKGQQGGIHQRESSNSDVEQVQESVPSSELSVQHEPVHAVVLPDQIQSAALVVIEQPADDDGELPENSTGLDKTNPVHFQFLDRLKNLESSLLARDPMMKTHLFEIHKIMIQYDDIPNLLRPQEIAKIMAAQQVHTNMTLAQTAAKKTSSAKKSVTQNLTLDDV